MKQFWETLQAKAKEFGERSERFLGRLQALDEPRKRRVLVGVTVIVMVVVIYVWLAYFNNLIMGNAPQIPGAHP